jgi:ankyrin repeat protein
MNKPQLISAILANNLSEVDSLLKAGANIDQWYDGFTPIQYAIKKEKINIAKLLVKNNANICIYDNVNDSPLKHIFMKFKEPTSLSFLKSFPSVGVADNYNRDTALHYAARRNYTKCVEYLIKNGADVNHQNRQGQSPVFLAVQYGATESLELLCQHGANVNFIDSENDKKFWSPIFYALAKSNYESAELLIHYGADLNIVDRQKSTPIFYAMHDTKLLELLVKNGANLEFSNVYGRTPLFDAVFTGNPHKVELLLNQGVNVDHKDNFGWTPIFYAIEGGNERIITYLLEHCNNLDYKVEIDDVTALSLAKRSKSPTVRALVESKIEQKILSTDVYADKSAVSLCL